MAVVVSSPHYFLRNKMFNAASFVFIVIHLWAFSQLFLNIKINNNPAEHCYALSLLVKRLSLESTNFPLTQFLGFLCLTLRDELLERSLWTRERKQREYKFAWNTIPISAFWGFMCQRHGNLHNEARATFLMRFASLTCNYLFTDCKILILSPSGEGAAWHWVLFKLTREPFNCWPLRKGHSFKKKLIYFVSDLSAFITTQNKSNWNTDLAVQ